MELRDWFEFESEDDSYPEEFIVGDREFEAALNKSDKVQAKKKLVNHLKKLKKDEFLLKVKIACWKETLTKKFEELKQAELQLDENHEVIWKNRDDFCADADKFAKRLGPFSEWWDAQMEFLADLEKFKQKIEEEKKSQEEMANLEKEIDELEDELGEEKAPTVAVAEVHASETGETDKSKAENVGEKAKPAKKVKKVRFADQIGGGDDTEEKDNEIKTDSADNEFPFVDVDLVKTVKRIRDKQRRRNRFARFIHNNFVIH